MDLLQTSRLYHPLQPPGGSGICYAEWDAAPVLCNLIRCYWELLPQQKSPTGALYRVVADGCTDVFVNVEDPRQSYVMGFTSRYTHFEMPPQFRYFGIRFYPAAFTVLTGIPGERLSGTVYDLKLVWQDLADLIRLHLEDTQDIETLRKKLNLFFCSYLTKKRTVPDGRLLSVLERIYSCKGNLTLDKYSGEGISPRHLRRLFLQFIGTPPKTFCRVVRFQQLVNIYPDRDLLRKEKHYFDLGFYDQAHFVHEVRAMTGLRPSDFFRSSSGRG